MERERHIFSRNITSALICIILCVIPALGCASRSLVPISDSGIAYPELLRASKTLGEVTVVVNSSPWQGSPDYLERYITPIYVEIQNNGRNPLNLSYNDFVLIDQNRTQFNPLTPQIVADTLKTVSESYFAYGPNYPTVSIGLGFGYFSGGPFYGGWPYYGPFYSPFYIYGNYPLGYYPPAYYSPPTVGNVFTKALIPGQVNPNAKLQGYIYFQKLPKEVSLATLNVGYRFTGEPVSYKLSFPFEYK
ncbi:MAG: hypothetical protein WBD99_15745 [Thermodesulfobacteriota bacterium]